MPIIILGNRVFFFTVKRIVKNDVLDLRHVLCVCVCVTSVKLIVSVTYLFSFENLIVSELCLLL